MCLESIPKNTDSEYEIVIVDDVSPDNTREWLQKWIMDKKSPNVKTRIIFHEENQGISKTWNDLIDNAGGDYICIINSDILFTPHWDTPLIEALDRYEVASPYHTMNEIPQDFPGGRDRVANILPVLGCCFMFKRGLIDKIGHFPEELRLWYGDNWLGKKAKCCHIHGSYVHHFISKSANKGLVPEFDLQINRDKAAFDALRL
jgi:glycosyltransferase involved in cell wall biosynthesis